MSVISIAVTWARSIAADDSHGYDQSKRWGADYDCSSLIISAYKAAGLKLTSTYTGNMYSDFCSHGFADVTSQINISTGAGLEAGDVLLNNVHHTAMYIGSGKIVQASINELGTTTGGATGDQTGREIYERSYYNYPWDCVLRYTGDATDDIPDAAKPLEYWPPRELEYKSGAAMMTGADVLAAQALLKCRGYNLDADGEFGPESRLRTMAFQVERGLEGDGIIGAWTWAALLSRG